MEIPSYVSERELDDPITRFDEQLRAVRVPFARHELLTANSALIGLLLLNKHRACDARDYTPLAIPPVSREGERYRRLEKLIPSDGFSSPELFNLLVFFFGTDKAPLVAHAWNRVSHQIYQTGFMRRSFRAPKSRDLCFLNQLNMLVAAIPQLSQWDMFQKKGKFYDLDVAGQIRHGHLFPANNLSPIWAAALDAGDEKIFRLMEDIVFNRDETGKVSRHLIKALLISERKEAWQLVEKLLLAAQRQEGLRQTILEVLDETSVGALKYMIGVVLEHKLARFSSVVRAIDTWAGFGWESEREKAITTFLEKARGFLDEPARIAPSIASPDNLEVYTALWAQGVLDIERCLPLLESLLNDGNAEKRALALKFAAETRLIGLQLTFFTRALDDSDQFVLAWALSGLVGLLAYGVTISQYEEACPALFDKLRRIVDRTDLKDKVFEGRLFSWSRVEFKRNQALFVMIDLIGKDKRRLDAVVPYFDGMSVELREKLTRYIFPEFVRYAQTTGPIRHIPEDFKREFAFRLLSDRGDFMVETAEKALAAATFTDAEMTSLQGLLKRKGASFRGRIIGLILNQNDKRIVAATSEMIANGDGEQCLAALDILLQLKKSDRAKSKVAELASAYKAQRKLSPKEEILLDQIVETEQRDVSAEAGYGFFDPKKCAPRLSSVRIDPGNIFEKRRARKESGFFAMFKRGVNYGFSVPFAKVKAELEKLATVLLALKDFEYQVERWNGSREKVLLGNTFESSKRPDKTRTPREEFETYPLFEVWEKWFIESGLDAGDLEIIELAWQPKPPGSDLMPPIEETVPAVFAKARAWHNPVLFIIRALRLVFPFAEKDEYMLGGCTRLFASIDNRVLQSLPKANEFYLSSRGEGWQQNGFYNGFFHAIDPLGLPDSLIRDFWNVAHWRQYSGHVSSIQHSAPPFALFCRAYELGVIGEDDLARGLLNPSVLRLFAQKFRDGEINLQTRFPFLRPLYEKAREHLLDIELRRGDSPTPVTTLAESLPKIYGTKRFVEILAGLGKTSLHRGYYFMFGGGDANKQFSFSRLLKFCHPLESDTQDDFDELVRKAKISEKRLIEAAVYAPQWQRFVSGFLNWKGLDSAIWWMHAHTKIAGYREQNSEAESEIAKYSAVDLEDFKDGAVDKNWFHDAVKQLGKERFEIVYDAAKYISEGNGHRRARLYADVLSGETKIREITERVRTKRDQDYLRVYGLAPLSRTNPSKDVLERYEYLQQFKKESRQFGSMKQTSEAIAVRVALDNLARNAGYTDPVRLTWAMETKQVQDILSKETEVVAGDVTVRLGIDADGKAELFVVKGDKTLKAIPAALKKDKRILELGANRKTLREQFRRSRKSLEEAMVRGDVFSADELATLFSHPVISKHLEKLVFVAGSKHGFYDEGKLIDANGAESALAGGDEVRIAHCVDLYKTGQWSEYQRHCFENELRQPFKQIFRELYLPTEDELREKTISRRYAGHQIQPAKTVALLKTRGWKAEYEEGLQKVFHRERFTAIMCAMADWFSPAEVENPTLETVEFLDLKTRKGVAFETIEPRIFSEVMRDVDLVVSVAHAGGIDPEASHSTIEMRAALLNETVRLFKLENVEVSGSHARIKGTMGEYSVHLGSAVVHKIPGTYLSILPVHAQQRGRIFLPFADEDPKSAELISKVLLLARDEKIQDPTILRQLV